MKKIILFILVVLNSSAFAGSNPMFGRTHMLPSPYTLPSGRLVLGTELSYGITDFLQIGTGILRDFYKLYNANAKLSLVDYPKFALAATGGFEHYNYKDISSSNPDLTITSYLPGGVGAFGISDQLALFLGGNLSFTKETLKTSGVDLSGYVRGAQAESDLSWAYNPPSKNLGNTISAGLSYDFSYKLVGYGISHTWPGFHLGFHYYPGASKNKLLPIIAGGAVVDL